MNKKRVPSRTIIPQSPMKPPTGVPQAYAYIRSHDSNMIAFKKTYCPHCMVPINTDIKNHDCSHYERIGNYSNCINFVSIEKFGSLCIE